MASPPASRQRLRRRVSPDFLAATKFEIPPVGPHLVARPALLEAVVSPAASKLTLLGAPAGSGKTTLLAQWCHARDGAGVAWVALEAADDDPVRFWACVITALRRLEPDFGARAEGALHTPGADLSGVVVPLLVNELQAAPEDRLLVLDDLHAITRPEIHASLAALLDHLPRHVRVLVASRTDPPLPLGRLRARGELAEVRAADLSFSDAEAAMLLAARAGPVLTDGEVADLRRRTEGWAAGLQLAALSLRDRASATDFIRSFAGDDRHVVDYLGAEVLNGLDADVRRFLLETSVLDRLAAPLCDAVVEGAGSATMLERLERDNVFVVALDARRDSYRYHHLFRELLLHELRRADPAIVPELHRRAAGWHRAHGHVPEAIEHALAAGDVEEGAALVRRHWPEVFNQGHLATVERWLGALPDDLVRHDAELWLARVWTALDDARLDDVDAWLTAAEAGTVGGTGVEDWAALLRGVYALKVGDVGAAARAVARAATDDGDPFRDTVAACVAGVAQFWRGELGAAELALRRAAVLAAEDDNGLAELYALGYLAALRGQAGGPEAAREPLQRCAELVDEQPGLDEHFVAVAWHSAAARRAAERQDPVAARLEGQQAVRLAARGAGRVEQVWALTELARVASVAGDATGAGAALDEARRHLARCADPGRAAPLLRAVEAAAGPPRAALPVRPLRGSLSERELAVLRLLPTELSQREIGAALFVSVNTVKTHVRNIYAKLPADDRDAAVARARELQLL